MKNPKKVVVADTPEELDAATAAAESRPAVQIDIEDYTAGGNLPLDVPEQLPDALIRADGGSDPDAINMLNAQRRKIHEQQRESVSEHAAQPAEIFPSPGLTRYESRIRIVEAWQYAGALTKAPAFVDRSWAAWADYDEERKLEPGPALRVPISHGNEREKLCRKGDYVVRQEVTIALGIDPDVRVEVWPREEFEKFFLPTAERPPVPPAPPAAEKPEGFAP